MKLNTARKGSKPIVFDGIIDRLRDICTVASKELTHCFRDAHVLIYTVFVPLILYPVSLVSLSEYTLWREGLAETRPIRVAFKQVGVEKIPELVQAMKDTKKIAVVESQDPDRDLEQNKVEAVIDGSAAPEKIEVVLNPSSDRFLESRVLLQSRSYEARSMAMKRAIGEAGAKNKLTRVFDIDTRNVGTIGGQKAKLKNMEITAFSTTIVLVAFYGYTMLIIAVGAIYPALAAFTEEYEKRTKATTYLLPVERSSVVLGKFAAVTTLTIISGLVNFISMAIVAVYFTSKLDWLRNALLFALKQYNLGNLLLLILIFFLSTLLVASIYSLVAACAKSFKEAQNASSLILILVTVLPMVALFPGWALDLKTAIIPVLNMVLAAKSIVTDSTNTLDMVIACTETIALTGVLLYISQIVFWGKEPSGNIQEPYAHPTSR